MSAMVPPGVVYPGQCCRSAAITEPVLGDSATRWAYAGASIS